MFIFVFYLRFSSMKESGNWEEHLHLIYFFCRKLTVFIDCIKNSGLLSRYGLNLLFQIGN